MCASETSDSSLLVHSCYEVQTCLLQASARRGDVYLPHLEPNPDCLPVHVPAYRLLSAMIPGQTAISQKHSPAAAVAAPAQYGPKTGSHAKLSRQASKRPQHLQGGSPSLQNLSQNPAYSFGSQAQSQASGQPRHVQPLSDARQQSRAAWGARQGGDPGGQQGSGRGRGATGAGLSAEEGSGPTEELMLQEEEVDWGGDGAGLGDPALQHALAVIRAKGEKGTRWGVGKRGGVSYAVHAKHLLGVV